jgi:peptidoglycan/LPS O-acetylase OafA/YrhL
LAPFLFLLFIVIYYIVLVSIYFENIVSKKISDYYYSFSKISTMLILGQVLMLVYAMSKYIEIPKKIFTILMLLGTINAIVLITLGIVLKFYTTDC